MKTTLEVVEVVNGECQTMFFMDVIDEEPWLVPLPPATEETPLFKEFKEGAKSHQGFLRCSHQVSEDGLTETCVTFLPRKEPYHLYLDYFLGRMTFRGGERTFIVGVAKTVEKDQTG